MKREDIYVILIIMMLLLVLGMLVMAVDGQ